MASGDFKNFLDLDALTAYIKDFDHVKKCEVEGLYGASSRLRIFTESAHDSDLSIGGFDVWDTSTAGSPSWKFVISTNPGDDPRFNGGQTIRSEEVKPGDNLALAQEMVRELVNYLYI